MSPDIPRLKGLFANPRLNWLVQRLKRRLELGESLTGSITLVNATNAEREATNSLLGRKPSSGKSLQVPLQVLERILQDAGLCESLEALIQILAGPVPNQKAARIEDDNAWQDLFQSFRARAATRPRVLSWIEELQSRGTVRRLSRNNREHAAALLENALKLVNQLPALGVPIATLAARSTGDSHALDPGSPLNTLVLRAAAALGGTTTWADAESRRDTWASVGVLCDELSAPVLTLNLRLTGESPLAKLLALQATEGQPVFLTTRQLLQTPCPFALPVARVYVCENPVIVATAANHLGIRSAPILCTDGQPKTALRILLNRLRDARTQIWYHGDFDWPGLRIANLIRDRHNAQPWRMSAADYLMAQPGKRLEGQPVPASWDSRLTEAMTATGRAVYEEQVIDTLLQDLALPTDAPS